MLTEIDNHLKELLQSNIIFIIKSKTIKRGKMTLYSIKENHIVLRIENDKEKESNLELPFPFLIEERDGNLVFDYKLKTLADSDTEILKLLKKQEPFKPSRFFDTELIMVAR